MKYMNFIVLILCAFACTQSTETVAFGKWETGISPESKFLEYYTHNSRVFSTEHFYVFSNGGADDRVMAFAEQAETAFKNLETFFEFSKSNPFNVPTTSGKFEIVYHVGDEVVTRAFGYGFILYEKQSYSQAVTVQHELVHVFQIILSDGKFSGYQWLTEGIADLLAEFKEDKITTVAELKEREQFFSEQNLHIMEMSFAELMDGLFKHRSMLKNYYSLAHLLCEYIFDPKGFGLSKSDIKIMYTLMSEGNSYPMAIQKLSGKNILELKEQLYEVLEDYLNKKEGTI